MSKTQIRLSLSALALAGAAGAAFTAAAMDALKDPNAMAQLDRLGFSLDARNLNRMASFASGMDANVLTGTIFPGTVGTPAQFLQNWLPGVVRTITQARKIDELVGIDVGGSWEDEEVIQTIIEPTGTAVPYTDYGNVPLSSWNPSWERRTIVRFEEGLRVGVLEEARAARANINDATEKRAAAALALELQRNRVGFYGYNGGLNRTYGFLNDPNLPAYVTVAAGVGGTTWALKTYLEIIADIRSAVSALQVQSGDQIDPDTVNMTLALPTGFTQYLTVTSIYGNSVRQWMTETYPKLRVVSAPELVAANGGANVFYIYADRVEDGSSDGGKVFSQIVPAKMKALGVEQQAKAYVEDYTNALGGIMVKRPYAVVRRSGI